MIGRYVVRPRADRDLDDQADYLAEVSSPNVGHRFLIAAHETFALLASQPEMGWPFKIGRAGMESLRVFRVSGFNKILVLYRPCLNGIEIVRVVHGSRNLQALFRRKVRNDLGLPTH